MQPGSISIEDEDAVISERDFAGLPGEFVALVGVLPMEADFIVIDEDPMLDGPPGWFNGLGVVDLLRTTTQRYCVASSATSTFALLLVISFFIHSAPFLPKARGRWGFGGSPLQQFLLPLTDLHVMQIVFCRDFVDRLDSPRGLQGHLGLEIRGEISSVHLFHGSRSKSAENAPTLKPQIQSSPWLHPPGPPLMSA